MKTFILKLLISTFFIYLLFEFTIGKRINYFVNSISEISNKENREQIKNKILEELKNANDKEFILDKNEKKIISTFLKKINKELELEKDN